MKFLYTIYCATCLVVVFLLLFPVQFILLQREAWKPLAHQINRVWGRLFFFMAGMPVRVERRFQPDPKQAYVFCANHFSYLDIAAMGVIVPTYYAFMGKSTVKRIPLLGYMFARLHIQVDRSQPNSRASSLTRSLRTLASGRSVMIFPEGGIHAKNPPQMVHPLRDGAFIMAIQQQIPIVPISLLTNYKILPDQRPVRVHWHPVRAVVHAPIPTDGMTATDVDRLKEETYRIIDAELMKTQLTPA